MLNTVSESWQKTGGAHRHESFKLSLTNGLLIKVWAGPRRSPGRCSNQGQQQLSSVTQGEWQSQLEQPREEAGPKDRAHALLPPCALRAEPNLRQRLRESVHVVYRGHSVERGQRGGPEGGGWVRTASAAVTPAHAPSPSTWTWRSTRISSLILSAGLEHSTYSCSGTLYHIYNIYSNIYHI